MKKVNTYSAQYKVIQPRRNNLIPQSFAPTPQSFTPTLNKKKLLKDRQEFINNIAASGFKQFIL